MLKLYINALNCIEWDNKVILKLHIDTSICIK